MPALRVCVRARTLCRTHGKPRYIMFIRTSRLAERLAPSRWSPTGQPLCAFAASCEVFFKSPSLSSACAAMATMCSAGTAEALRDLEVPAALGVIPSVGPSDLLQIIVSAKFVCRAQDFHGNRVIRYRLPSILPTEFIVGWRGCLQS